jgi:hypothetical protein
LAGDCNARTAELKDFSVFTKHDFQNGDEYLLEHYNISPIKASSSNLNNVADTFTQNTNLLSFFYNSYQFI